MFGYRTFKIFGALIIIALTQWTNLTPDVIDLSWVIMLGCVIWIGFLLRLYKDYRAIRKNEIQMFAIETTESGDTSQNDIKNKDAIV